MTGLQVRPAATRDVEQSSLFYLLEGGEPLSLRFEEAVCDTYRWLLENPCAGSPRPSLSPRLSGLRMWQVRGFETHLVFYRATDDGIEVVRVLHGARDVPGILEGSQ